MTTMGRLVVYGQEWWHNPVYLVGDRLGLQQIRDTIDRALNAGCAASPWVKHSDGESYPVVVLVASAAQMNNVAVPYTDDCARDRTSQCGVDGLLSEEAKQRLRAEMYGPAGHDPTRTD